MDLFKKRGEVLYIGKVQELANGYWIGVRLDEPSGDSDGTFNSNVYFVCAENYGKFYRPNEIEMGNFPVEDNFNVDDDMI